jgi:ABC-type bacteriocin/lantibiotic exporter with double-glycine peptidase domain
MSMVLRILEVNQRWQMAYLLLGSICLAILEMGSVAILGPVIQTIYGSSSNFFEIKFISEIGLPQGNIAVALIFLCTFVIAKNFLAYLFQKIFSRTIFRLKANLSKRLFKKYLSQNYQFYLQSNSADLINNISNVTSIFSQHSVMGLINLIADLLIVVLILGYLFYIQPLGMLVASIFFGGILFFVNGKAKKALDGVGYKRKMYETAGLKNLQQTFSAIKEVKVFGSENYFLSKYALSNDKNADVETVIQIYQSLPKLWFECVGLLTLAILLMTAIYLGSSREELVVLLAIFGAGAFRLIPAMSRILGSIQLVRSSQYAIQILFDQMVIDRTQVINVPVTQKKIIFSDLSIKNLCFKYPGSQELTIKNLHVKVQKGEILGLVAPSGSGKSTLITLIMGLLNPTSGEILVNNLNINTCLKEWQEIIGYVPQNVYLSDESILENILFSTSADAINHVALEYALRISKVDHLIKELPQGLNTSLGDFGTRFSGGQKQRIAIARALYREPQLMILDEATTGLDAEVESEIFSALADIKHEVTMIVISHNQSVLNNCDRVVYL